MPPYLLPGETPEAEWEAFRSATSQHCDLEDPIQLCELLESDPNLRYLSPMPFLMLVAGLESRMTQAVGVLHLHPASSQTP